MMSAGEFDLIAIDEIDIVPRYNYMLVSTVVDALEQRSKRTSVIFLYLCQSALNVGLFVLIWLLWAQLTASKAAQPSTH